MKSYAKKQLISWTAPLIAGLGLHRFFEAAYAGMGHILTFHRVVPASNQKRIHNHLSLEISPAQLEATILFYQKKGYHFASLDEWYQCLQQGSVPKKMVAFTFDDGYKDNYTIAHPILKKHRVPFAIYVATHFPDRKAILWWYLLEDMLRERPVVSFEYQGQVHEFDCDTQRKKENAFDQIRSLINQSFRGGATTELLKNILQASEEELYEKGRALTMSWKEINQLSKDPLCTIGAHTVHHYPLIHLSDEQLIKEVDTSRQIIAQQIGKAVEHFAYPFGKAAEASHREFALVKSLGFKTATTTRMGNIFYEHKDKLECLPRISINRVTDERVLQLQTSGLLPCLVHRGKRVITH
ncbi:MAG: polysaccharide deacetylase family protein [Bacteroidota bacterium]